MDIFYRYMGLSELFAVGLYIFLHVLIANLHNVNCSIGKVVNRKPQDLPSQANHQGFAKRNIVLFSASNLTRINAGNSVISRSVLCNFWYQG